MSERIVQQPLATERQAKFSDLPTAEMERSTFDMSHPWKGTMDLQKLVPIMCQEILPGDTFQISTTAFMRLATPIKPLMDNISADIHYFFVPNRIVWDNWVYFMGERRQPDDDPNDYEVPEAIIDLDITNPNNLLQDYFGIPMKDTGGQQENTRVNALPFRAYQKITADWYVNQNIGIQIYGPTDDGPDDLTGPLSGELGGRHKRGDYFVRALPWPQKGDPVYLPLGTEAPIIPENSPWYFEGSEDNEGVQLRRDVNDPQEVAYDKEGGGVLNPDEDILPKMIADLTTATAASINDIRTAFQIQRLLERDARGGTRYIEILLSHFNVQSPDFRLQRSEFLGGGSARINVNPVAATVASEDAPQGNLAAVGTGLVRGGTTHSFTEHGYIIGILSCRTDQTYQNGMDRMWKRSTRYDFYWPALSHLGEQQITNGELFYQNNAEDNETWGYQERYAEYRYQPGRITGKFRSADPESLDVWHLAQDYDELPNLSPAFIYENPPIDRVVAVPSEPDLLVDVWHEVRATRPMPVYAVPGMVDHF